MWSPFALLLTCLSFLLISFSSHLAQNPFICDCNLKWLADYLRSNPIETSGARCASPRRLANKRIGQIKSKKFRCSGRPESRCLLISLSLSISQTGLFICSASTFLLSTESGFYLSVLFLPHTTLWLIPGKRFYLACYFWIMWLVLLNRYVPW